MNALLISSLAFISSVLFAGDWLDNPEFYSHYRTLRAFDPGLVLQTVDKANLPEDAKRMLKGWAHFQKGNYSDAISHLEKIRTKPNEMGEYLAYRAEEIQKSAEKIQHFQVYETEHFSIRVEKGKDQIMYLFMADILENAFKVYSDIFKDIPEEKIIVEIMPDHTLFSYASALTKSQIETTGTVALCVENRLAVISPRRVLMGYYWPDVVTHELVHYFLTRQSRDHAPLWFQEGVAKYLETRWENPNAKALDKHLESALARGLKQNRMITFEEMHPSFAALPTAELAQQAYAQVASMVDYITGELGVEIIQKFALDLAEEKDMEALIQQAMGMEMEHFIEQWQVWARQQNYQIHQVEKAHGVTLLESDQSSDSLQQPELEDLKRKKHTQLGDLLMERNRMAAAYKQYSKAAQGLQSWPRQLILRQLLCLEALDDPEESLGIVENQVKNLEDDPTMLKHQAKALLKLERIGEAQMVLTRALRLNPFDPNIHYLRRSIGEKKKDQELLEQVNKVLEILSNPQFQVENSKS